MKKHAPSFETALSELEKIVASIEDGQLSLEHLVKQYETGKQLLAICENHLKQAALKLDLSADEKAS